MVTLTSPLLQFDQIEFNEENIDNQLTALIAYYAYLIIGLDLDSFSPIWVVKTSYNAAWF